MKRWNELGARLRARDPQRFRKLAKLADAYLSVYVDPDEPESVFRARLASIASTGDAS